jgi:hypothetical protein
MNIDVIQIKSYHQNLRKILVWLERSTGFKFTITSPFRMNDSGVHGTMPLRAVDLRCRSIVVGRAIESIININWSYDSSRPEMSCVLLHGEDENLHLHIKVHDNTKRIRS